MTDPTIAEQIARLRERMAGPIGYGQEYRDLYLRLRLLERQAGVRS